MLLFPISCCAQQKFLDLSGLFLLGTPQSNLSWLSIILEVFLLICFSKCRRIPKWPADSLRFTFYDVFCFPFGRSVPIFFKSYWYGSLFANWKHHILPFRPDFCPQECAVLFSVGSISSPTVISLKSECWQMFLKVSCYPSSDRSG